MDAFFGGLTFGISGTGNGISDCNLLGSVSDVLQSTGTASSSSALSGSVFNGGYDTYSGTGTATTQYGTVSAGASGAVTTTSGGAAGGTAESVGYGIASDTLSFDPLSAGSGTNGYVVLGYSINGSLAMSAQNAGAAAAEVAVQVGSLSPQVIFYSVDQSTGLSLEGYTLASGLSSGVTGCSTGSSGPASFSCVGGVISTQKVAISFNAPTAVDLGLYIGADPGTYGASTNIDPGVSLTSITLYNASNEQISDFTVTSGSGATYGADGIESQPFSNTPEPATFGLAACALAAFAWARRGLRQRA
jgi:hypothetical protein